MIISRVFRFSVVATLLVAAMAANPQPASAIQRNFLIRPDAAPPGYTHLLCYNVKYGKEAQYNVTLTDQFYPDGFQTSIVGPTEAACTPAKKKLLYRKPLTGFTPNGHFVCYPLLYPPQGVDVTTRFSNQLQASSLLWVQPFALCVPTYKYSGAGLWEGAAPKGYTHLLVYDNQVTLGSLHGVVFQNALQATTVTIADQFYPNGFTTTLGNPYILLTPTKKIYAKPRKVVPNGHWIWYQFTPQTFVDDSRDYVNQLEKNSLTAYFPYWLMVPTYKYKP
ncbi:MAG TPA: hypothetical protein VKR56_02850 [Candidatus Cybelea sp.]|nr:hypothetical protein [Candidatus Cybelea sp.]